MFLSWVFYLAVFLRNSYVFLRDVNWRGGYAQTSFQIRAQRIFGAVPLGLQENAKGGEAGTQLAGGSAGAALCVEDVAVLYRKSDCRTKSSTIAKGHLLLFFTVGSRMRAFYIFYSKYV